MATFNPQNKDILTTGELLKPAMKIKDQKEADLYKEAYINYVLDRNEDMTRAKAEGIVNHNIGYWTGYYGDDVRERVEKLFKTEHPLFGKFSENGSPSFKEALNLGYAIAKSREKDEGEKDTSN